MMIKPDDAYRSGFVTLIGRPNVGKSTLLNQLAGQKIAAASPRPQTTRRKQLGIITLDDAQIIFMDTPGIHNAQHRLGNYMNDVAVDTLNDADLILWLVDTSKSPDDEDQLCAGYLTADSMETTVMLVLNKVDLLSQAELSERQTQYQDLVPDAVPVIVSATQNIGLDELIQIIISHLPVGMPYYDEEQITDFYEREVAADLIREAALNHLRDEVPHSIAVRIDDFKERSEEMAYIAATIFVERESHKGIVIGKSGSMIKVIGASAREEIEEMSGRKVYLELRVKVHKNWRNLPAALKLFGYSQNQT